MTRNDISASGPIVYRDRQTNQTLAHYSVGFMGFFVVAFDRGTLPKIADSYFTDAKHKTRYERLSDFMAKVPSEMIEDLRKEGVHIK